MTIYNLGSINWDRIYQLRHFPAPGETISSLNFEIGLGGKGLNQSIAITRAGGSLVHCGAIGAVDTQMKNTLKTLNIDISSLEKVSGFETGTAIILLDQAGENSIILEPGANQCISKNHIEFTLQTATKHDWFLAQNETNNVEFAIDCAAEKGMKIALAAAPFDADVVLPLLQKIDLLAVNEIEYEQIMRSRQEKTLPQRLRLFLTKGAKGMEYHHQGEVISSAAPKVNVVDTTGAGDTALGSFLARLDLNDSIQNALNYAVAASALQVTKKGAVGAIPAYAEVQNFLESIQY